MTITKPNTPLEKIKDRIMDHRGSSQLSLVKGNGLGWSHEGSRLCLQISHRLVSVDIKHNRIPAPLAIRFPVSPMIDFGAAALRPHDADSVTSHETESPLVCTGGGGCSTWVIEEFYRESTGVAAAKEGDRRLRECQARLEPPLVPLPVLFPCLINVHCIAGLFFVTDLPSKLVTAQYVIGYRSEESKL